MSEQPFLQRVEQYRAYPPLEADSHFVRNDRACPGCSEPFKVGDVVTLVVIGPGADPEERERARNGRFYNATAVPAHYACVTGKEVNE